MPPACTLVWGHEGFPSGYTAAINCSSSSARVEPVKLTGLLSCGSSASNHTCCDFVSTMAVSCLKESVSQPSSPPPDSYCICLKSPSTSFSLNFWGKNFDIDIPFRIEYSQPTIQNSVTTTSLYINWGPLGKEFWLKLRAAHICRTFKDSFTI